MVGENIKEIKKATNPNYGKGMTMQERIKRRAENLEKTERMYCQGKSYREIAEELNVAQSTVKKYINVLGIQRADPEENNNLPSEYRKWFKEEWDKTRFGILRKGRCVRSDQNRSE